MKIEDQLDEVKSLQTSGGRRGRYDVQRLHRRSFTISRGSQWRRFSIYYQFSEGFGRAIWMHPPALIICRFSFPVGLALPPFYLPLSSITRGDRKIFIFVDLRAFSTLSETKTLRDASCLDVTINWKILNYMMIFDKTSFLWNNFKNSRKGKENVVKKFLFFWWKWFLLLRI